MTYFVRKWALNKSILDEPNERSSHSIPTPRGGGIAIAITWFLAIGFLFFQKDIDLALFSALLCGIPISVIGLVDDVFTISPKLRLFIQTASATLALIFLGGLNSIDVGFSLLTVPYLFSIIAIIGIVWFTNLFNFLDGIDGYISAEVIFIGFSFFLLFGGIAPVLLAAITAGFLVWNWQPAKIFMGDVGSTLLGFTIGVFAVYYQNSGDSSIIIWLMLTSLFWFDASLTLFRRWRNGETLSKAHKKHAYQRIVQSGFSHQKTVIYSLLINFSILGLVWLAIRYPIYSLIFLGINLAYLYLIMKMVDKRFPFQK
ncbi:MraY family glycosyltransferase [Williamwhitmania taraxaci]|uniref:MraY family glycosyltransferase n=1 Tax=Williamwhitmania taraxaci TaxID=1640674 RepID=UPI001BAEB0B5|nr:glycosyltransferase family 4 protein [Williamwhitmania taraxaci]